MPLLSRRTTPLLRKVAGKAHATESHHESPTQDIFAEPESSEDEIAGQKSSPVITSSATTGKAKNPSHRSTDRKVEAMKGAKRDEGSLFDNTDDLFGSNLHPRARKLTKYGSTKFGQQSKSSKPSSNNKNNQKPTAKGKEKRTATGFRSPPTSSPLTPPIAKVEFILPPLIDFKSVLPTTSFQQPPTARSTRSTRSTAHFINPETSRTDTDPTLTNIETKTTLVTNFEPFPETFADRPPSSCPTCGVQVSEELLDEWKARYPQMSIRIQQRFCRKHHLLAALKRWEESHPSNLSPMNIGWAQLDGRLHKLRSEMLWLIERPEQSFYRAQFEKSIVNTGGSRTMMKHVIGASKRKKTKTTEEFEVDETPTTNTASISVGYYGTKGLKMMMDFITSEFSAPLRAQIVSDKLIAARDVSGYIHMVLAPELATRLVMEDMNVDKNQAREIMAESAELGDLLHGSTEDEKRS